MSRTSHHCGKSWARLSMLRLHLGDGRSATQEILRRGSATIVKMIHPHEEGYSALVIDSRKPEEKRVVILGTFPTRYQANAALDREISNR